MSPIFTLRDARPPSCEHCFCFTVDGDQESRRTGKHERCCNCGMHRQVNW